MGLTRKQAIALGLGDLFPSGSKGSRAPAHERFAMNRTESRFAEHLEARKLAGEIRGWEFERDTFVLSPDMTLTPDFRIETNDRMYEFVDVKGKHTWDDSVVKGKAAAALFPQHRFFLAKWEADRVTAKGVFRHGRWAIRQLGVPRKPKGGTDA